jgi:hypothetical protein
MRALLRAVSLATSAVVVVATGSTVTGAPVAPSPPKWRPLGRISDAETEADADALLAIARRAFARRDFDRAIAIAQIVAAERRIEAWPIFAASKCALNDLDGFGTAFDNLPRESWSDLRDACEKARPRDTSLDEWRGRIDHAQDEAFRRQLRRKLEQEQRLTQQQEKAERAAQAPAQASTDAQQSRAQPADETARLARVKAERERQLSAYRACMAGAKPEPLTGQAQGAQDYDAYLAQFQANCRSQAGIAH